MLIIGLAEKLVRTIKQGYLRMPLHLRHATWLLFIALIDLLAFRNTFIAPYLSDDNTRVLILVELLSLIWIAQLNLRRIAFNLVMVGAALNLLVITANGGLMPVTPELVHQIHPDSPSGSWYLGERLGTQKAVVLEKENTALWLLSDIFLLPTVLPIKMAISIGDIFLTAGYTPLILGIGREVLLPKTKRRRNK